MRADEATEEAERALRICAACMYCDDYCAVFPALAGRRAYAPADIAYLANLCHDCRGCLHACQYAPPHVFAVDLPGTLAQVRLRTYSSYARPRVLGRAFASNGRVVAAAALFAVFAVWIVAAPDMRFGSQPGEGAFYRIVPRGVMAGAAGAALAASLAALALGARAFWRDIAPSSPKGAWRRALPRAIREAVSLRHLGGRTGGGAAGCAERPARIRRLFHHAMVAGLAASFASTVVAALYERFLGWHGPYPVASLPVELGLVGGGFVLAGVAGLFWLKGRTDQTTIVTETRSIDQAFLALLASVAASGLALLWLRDTPAIGLCLILHLGLVLAFFLVLPAGKFVHAIYRSAALLRAAIETRESQRGDGDSG
jgi:citrate/tricarballylate utilization protein